MTILGADFEGWKVEKGPLEIGYSKKNLSERDELHSWHDRVQYRPDL
jgi:hypothetical protein